MASPKIKPAALLAAASLSLVMLVAPVLAQQPAPQPRPAPTQRPAARPAAPEAARELPPAGTIMVVTDVIKLLNDSTAAQAVRDQIDKQRQSFQADLQKQENELRNVDQELARQRAILAPEAFAQRRREFEKKISDAQQQLQDRRRQLDQAYSAAMQKVNEAINEVVLEIVQERNYQVVLSRSQIVAVQTALDITPEVLRRLNRKLPTVAVSMPKR
jgi:Skp family chaperone for outer membrane proteins